jgi:hypothetical protein
MASDAFVAIIACGKAEAKQGHELRAKQGQIFFLAPGVFHSRVSQEMRAR